MNTRELTTLACKLGNRVNHIDSEFKKGRIGKERYITERIAIDTIVSYIAEEIGYEPLNYMHYSDVIIAQETAKRKAETEQRLKTAVENKAKADSKTEVLFNAFVAGMNIAGFKSA